MMLSTREWLTGGVSVAVLVIPWFLMRRIFGAPKPKKPVPPIPRRLKDE